MTILRSAKNGLVRAGKREYIKYLEGGKISRPQAIKAKCYDCNGMGESRECSVESCALLLFSPYNPNKRKKNKININNTERL